MFIVIYGINNLGKTTQAKRLVERLRRKGQTVEYLKYPIYDLGPTGLQLNAILRNKQQTQISKKDLQALYAQNRRDFQPTLQQRLAAGTIVVAEDYTGTGLAWGMASGVPLETLEQLNAGLLREDLGILLEGNRFLSGREAGHLHESDDALTKRCRQTHQELAKKYGWRKVNANQPEEQVADDIWKIVRQRLTV